jgi:hypothetical protein
VTAEETPRDEYLFADVGGHYAVARDGGPGLPRLAQASALAPNIPEVRYQVAVGYERLHRASRRWGCI